MPRLLLLVFTVMMAVTSTAGLPVGSNVDIYRNQLNQMYLAYEGDGHTQGLLETLLAVIGDGGAAGAGIETSSGDNAQSTGTEIEAILSFILILKFLLILNITLYFLCGATI